MTIRRGTFMEAADHVAQMNRKLVGWANYFSLGPVNEACPIVDAHTRHRLRQWLCVKHKVSGRDFPALRTCTWINGSCWFCD